LVGGGVIKHGFKSRMISLLALAGLVLAGLFADDARNAAWADSHMNAASISRETGLISPGGHGISILRLRAPVASINPMRDHVSTTSFGVARTPKPAVLSLSTNASSFFDGVHASLSGNGAISSSFTGDAPTGSILIMRSGGTFCALDASRDCVMSLGSGSRTITAEYGASSGATAIGFSGDSAVTAPNAAMPAIFRLRKFGPPNSVDHLSSTEQLAAVNASFQAPLRVTDTDCDGLTMPDEPVTFENVQPMAGTQPAVQLSNSVAINDSNGRKQEEEKPCFDHHIT
jgi:hypothetical protein